MWLVMTGSTVCLPASSKDDGNIPIGFVAVQTNQKLSHLGDDDGLSHIQDEEFSPRAHGASLDDQADGLRDQHEITLHLRRRDGDRPPGCDLELEFWDDASSAALRDRKSVV